MDNMGGLIYGGIVTVIFTLIPLVRYLLKRRQRRNEPELEK